MRKLWKRRPAYFLISYRSPNDSLVRTEFMTREQSDQHQGRVVEKSIPIEELGGKYWFCEVGRVQRGVYKHVALSTAQVRRRLNRGFVVRVVRGPLENRNDAESRLEGYWEALMDRDED